MEPVSPKVDNAFKKIWEAQESKDFIKSSVGAADQVADATLLDSDTPKNFTPDKLSILDNKATNQNQTRVNKMMLKSMTGFGKATYEDEEVAISVKVQATNAKGIDINVQVPSHLEDQVLGYQHLIKNYLQRGKIDLFITHMDMQLQMDHVAAAIQEPIFQACYHRLAHLAKSVGDSTEALLPLVLQMPGVITPPLASPTHVIPAEKLEQIRQTIQKAIQQCAHTREQEGEVLACSITTYLATIRKELACVEKLDTSRITEVKARLVGKLNMLEDKQSLDEGRLEQELVYYLEKLDFQEERVRLISHLDYFEEIMHGNSPTGKHLSFVAQEMGREMNTLGAKANNARIQQHVTIMKSELEKIKEQLQNIV